MDLCQIEFIKATKTLTTGAAQFLAAKVAECSANRTDQREASVSGEFSSAIASMYGIPTATLNVTFVEICSCLHCRFGVDAATRLEDLSRKELQQLSKSCQLKANGKTADLILSIRQHFIRLGLTGGDQAAAVQ